MQSPISQHINNSHKVNGHCPDYIKDILNLEDCAQAYAEITRWQDYQATELYDLNNLASELNVAQILYKDEGTRLGFGSFKALGGAYGVLKFLQHKLSANSGQSISMESIRRGEHRELATEFTVVTATDGHHGRSIAWGAQRFGCHCRIYIHSEVSKGRQQAMEELGATVIRIKGNYNDSVHLAASDAEEHGWHIVSDTSYEGYTEIPRHILAGYTVMAEEISIQLIHHLQPSHIFLQGGVGGLASALCAYFWQHYGTQRPKVVVIEPDRAPCLMASAIAGKPTTVEVTEETIMAGLSCGEVSMLSWQILAAGTDDFLSIPDDQVPHMMARLAEGRHGDPCIIAGESAVAGLAALVAARQDAQISESLGLDSRSRILLIGTEGATDPEIYQAIITATIETMAGPLVATTEIKAFGGRGQCQSNLLQCLSKGFSA